MTTEEIIENLKLMQSQVEWEYPMDYAAAIDEAIIRVGAFDQIKWERDIAIEQLKQLGYSLGEQPREPDSDLISRRAAIEALDKRFDNVPMELTGEILLLRSALRKMPSAKMEGIRKE